MKQKPIHISNFEIGDIIVRMEPALSLSGKVRDRSYLGKPLKFLGIANGCIYVEKFKEEREDEMDMHEIDGFNLSEMFNMLMGEIGPRTLPEDLWSEGWAHYIDPYSIGKEEKEQDNFRGETRASLEKKLQKALDNEDYRLAEKIKRIINK